MTDQPPLTRAQRRELPIQLTEEERALAQEVITLLNETNKTAWKQIQALVRECGIPFVRQTLQETLQIEEQGGMMVKSGKRRRTPGGVFLHLMSERITQQQRRDALYLYQDQEFRKRKKKKKQQQKKLASAEATPPQIRLPTPNWDIFYEYLEVLYAQRGVLTTVKITLIGRPGEVTIHQDTVIALVENTPKELSFPKGVPTPPLTPTVYTIYIALKQWRRVEEALQNPDDALIIEGTCAYDAELPGMVVFATNTTTKGLELAKRESKGSTPKAAANPKAAPSAPPAPKEYPLPPNLPPSVAQKLHDLYSAADQFRQKLAVLEAKPPDQRLGYAMTQKLLKSTEDQIEALEKQYR